MKSIFRFGVMLVVVAMLCTFALPAVTLHAQSDMCFGLKADDCLLANNVPDSAGMQKLTSFVMDYTLTTKVTGTDKNDVDLKVTGTGPFSVDAAAMSGGSSDPAAAVNSLSMGNVINASLVSGADSQKGTFEFRIVGGNIYFKGDLATKDKWMKANIMKVFGQLSQNPMLAGMMGGGKGGQAGALSSNPAMAALSDPEVMNALSSLPNIPGVIKATRGEDVVIGGVKAAQFTYNFDIVTLVKAKEFAPVLKAALKGQSGGQTVDDKQVNQIIVAAQMFLKDFKFSIVRYVATDSKLPLGIGLHLALHLDEATASMVTSSSSSKPLDVAFDFEVKLSKVGEKVTVEPVADATEVDAGSMAGAGAMGGMAATPAK